MHQHDRRLALRRQRRRLAGSWVNAETSLTMRAPASIAFSMTAWCRVSIDTTAPTSAECPHDRHGAPDFFAGRQLDRTGTRRLAADIDNVGAGCDERTAVCDRTLGIEPAPAIGEAVGRHVEHAHHERAVEGKPAQGGRGADSSAAAHLRAGEKRAPALASQPSNSAIGAVTETGRRSELNPMHATRVKARPGRASGRARPAATASAAARP